MSQDSIRELAKLEFLSEQIETMDEFAQVYESMLDQYRNDTPMIRALQRVLMQQGTYLMNQWLNEKKAAGSLQLNPGSFN